MSKFDTQIAEMLTKVDAKKAKVKNLQKRAWASPGSTVYNGSTLNIKTCSDIELLIEVYATMKRNAADFEAASKEILGVERKAALLNYPISDWLTDIKNRVEIINATQELKKLEAAESKLNALASEDMKTEKALSDLMKELE